jgi:hypothetical protein
VLVGIVASRSMPGGRLMKKLIGTVAALFALGVITYAQTGAAGKWTGEAPGRGGPQTVTLELKVSGGTVAGTFTQGEMSTPISNGKVVDAGTITFSRTVMGRGGEIVINYTGKISGNELTLTPALPEGAPPPGGGGGGRGGRGALMPITLKRAG